MIGIGVGIAPLLCGTSANDESFDGYFVIMAGQSNATDRFNITGNLPAAMQGAQTGVYTYYKTANTSADNGSWVALEAGVNTQAGSASGKFGLDVVIGNTIYTTYGKEVYICPTAVGGSYIANDEDPSWHISHTDIDQYYPRMHTTYVYNAYQAIRSTKKLKPVMVWVHGESDSDTVAHGQAYETALTNLISDFRTRMGWSNMPVIIPKIRSDYGGTNLGLSDVRTAMDNIIAGDDKVFLVDCDTSATPLSTDGQHYNPIVDSYGGTLSALNLGDLIATSINTNVKPISQPEWDSASAYIYEADLAFSYMTPTPPTTAEKVAINDFIVGSQADANWQEIDRCYIWGVTTQQNARINIKTPSDTEFTEVGSPTFTTTKGYTGASGKYIQTGYIPSVDGVKFTLNKNFFSIYSLTDVQDDNYIELGVYSGGANDFSYQRIRRTSNGYREANNSATELTGTVTNSIGLFTSLRTSSTVATGYKNASSVTTGTLAAGTLPSKEFYALALNVNGTAGSESSRQVAFTAWGGGDLLITLWNTRVQALASALGWV